MRKNEVDYILSCLLESYPHVSDINISVGKPFQVENYGELKPVLLDPPILKLTPFQTELFAFNLIQNNPQLLYTLLKTGSCDCSYQLGNQARFRVNIFSQRGSYSIVLRRLTSQVPSIGELRLPPIFTKMAEERNGLILITGATGTGKSTSLAALLRYINENKAVHIITLEDPIEFEHTHIKATFNQREVGSDVESFAAGLRAALREAPKVILVGEIRDRESMEITLTAAETGHLVLSTLHTINAGQTINRIVGLFEPEEEQLVRMRLSETLRWIVCQKLVPTTNQSRMAIFEIMAQTLRTQEIIVNKEKEDKQFYDIIADGSHYGMHTFDQQLLELFAADVITEETAKSYCTRKSYVIQGIDQIKATKGVVPNETLNMEMTAKIRPKVAEDVNVIMPTKMHKMPGPVTINSAYPTAMNVGKKTQPPNVPANVLPPALQELLATQNPAPTPPAPQKNPPVSPNKQFTTQEIINLELEN